MSMAEALKPCEAIKTMKLYHGLERIERQLRIELGEDAYASDGDNSSNSNNNNHEADTLDPEVLARVDSLHFDGDEPVRHILGLLAQSPLPPRPPSSPSPDAARLVLDVGTGYGGTARLLAHRSGCDVHALELQPDMLAVGSALTRRCRLDDRVAHVLGDVLDPPGLVLASRYDAIVGLLSFLHIGHWDALFARCHASLRDGGFLFVHDFYVRAEELPQEDADILRDDVYCSSLLRESELRAVLARSGFRRVELRDRTDEWTPYVLQRAERYHAELPQHVARDGELIAHGLDHFYASVARIFQLGNVGGYSLVAWKD